MDCLADRVGVDEIVLVAPDERMDELRRGERKECLLDACLPLMSDAQCAKAA
jgi:hypothetical protein